MNLPVHEVTLLAVSRPVAGLIRLELGLPGDSAFRASGLADDWLRLSYPGPGGTARMVTLSLRRQDGQSLLIDIALHDHSPLCDWAQAAQPGATLRISDASGLYAPPAGGWQILLADLAGLPAAARILEELPAGAQGRAILEVPGRAQRMALAHPPGVELVWIHGGNGQAPGRLADLFCNSDLPASPGYVWAGAEQATARALRRHLRGRAGISHNIVAYWIAEAEVWRAGWEALPPATRAEIDRLWSSTLPPDEIQLSVDRALEACGL